MLHVLTADLEIDDDPIRARLLGIDVEDGDLHIRQGHRNVGQHAHGVQGVDLGLRKSLSDVGATVCDFFGVKAPQNGESFLELLK